MNFVEHGSYHVYTTEKVFHVDATGPFNDELIKRYREDLELCVGKLERDCWGHMVTFRDLSLFVPDTESSLIK